MNRWLIVVGREFKTRVRKRAFIIATLLGPILMVGAIVIIAFLAEKATQSNAKGLFVDHNNLLT